MLFLLLARVGGVFWGAKDGDWVSLVGIGIGIGIDEGGRRGEDGLVTCEDDLCRMV